MLDFLKETALSLGGMIIDFVVSSCETVFDLIASGFSKIFDYAFSAVSSWLGF